MISWLDVTWPMMASASLILGLIHGFVWLRRGSRAHLAFAIAAVSVAAHTLLELMSLHATDPAQLATLLRWMQVPLATMVLALVWFVHLFLGAGSLQLGVAAAATRVAALVLAFTTGDNLNHTVVTDVGRAAWWGGEVVSYPIGEPNPWIGVAQLGNGLLIAYLGLTLFAAWRRGDRAERRAALVVCGAWLFFVAVMVTTAVLMATNAIRLPYLGSPSFLLVILATSYQLGADLSRSAQLSEQLQLAQLRTLQSEHDLASERHAAADRFRSLFEHAPMAILLVDPEGRIAQANGLADRLFGRSREDMDGRLVETLVPERLRREHAALRTTFAAGSGTETLLATGRRMNGLRADGTEFPIEIALKRVVFADRTYTLATVTDLTTRNRAEAEAAQQREELAHLSRVTMIGELSGSLAHELNQPLTAILSNAQAAQRILASDPVDTGELQDILADIVDDDRRAGEVIQRMRALLKKGHVDHVPVDLNALVADVLRLIRSDLIHRGVEAVAELPAGMPSVAADPVQLQQVIVNLIFNACDAMKGTAGRRIVHVRTLQPVEGSLRVVVEDAGTGIPDGMLEKIFEPFETTKAQGLGLGLAVCRTILAAHGGRIWAENIDTGGARVCFELSQPKGAE